MNNIFVREHTLRENLENLIGGSLPYTIYSCQKLFYFSKNFALFLSDENES